MVFVYQIILVVLYVDVNRAQLEGLEIFVNPLNKFFFYLFFLLIDLYLSYSTTNRSTSESMFTKSVNFFKMF